MQHAWCRGTPAMHKPGCMLTLVRCAPSPDTPAPTLAAARQQPPALQRATGTPRTLAGHNFVRRAPITGLTFFCASLFGGGLSNGAHSMAKHGGHGILMWLHPRGSGPWVHGSQPHGRPSAGTLVPLHPGAHACTPQVLRNQEPGGGVVPGSCLAQLLQACRAQPRCMQPSMAAHHGCQSTT